MANISSKIIRESKMVAAIFVAGSAGVSAIEDDGRETLFAVSCLGSATVGVVAGVSTALGVSVAAATGIVGGGITCIASTILGVNELIASWGPIQRDCFRIEVTDARRLQNATVTFKAITDNNIEQNLFTLDYVKIFSLDNAENDKWCAFIKIDLANIIKTCVHKTATYTDKNIIMDWFTNPGTITYDINEDHMKELSGKKKFGYMFIGSLVNHRRMTDPSRFLYPLGFRTMFWESDEDLDGNYLTTHTDKLFKILSENYTSESDLK